MDEQSKSPQSKGGAERPPVPGSAQSSLSAIGRIQVMIDAAERSATEIAESAALLAKRASEIRIESEELISSLEETKSEIQQQLSPAPPDATRQARTLAIAEEGCRGERSLGGGTAAGDADVGGRQQPRGNREPAPR